MEPTARPSRSSAIVPAERRSLLLPPHCAEPRTRTGSQGLGYNWRKERPNRPRLHDGEVRAMHSLRRGAALTRAEKKELGPVQILVLGFENLTLQDGIVSELGSSSEARSRSTRRYGRRHQNGKRRPRRSERERSRRDGISPVPRDGRRARGARIGGRRDASWRTRWQRGCRSTRVSRR